MSSRSSAAPRPLHQCCASGSTVASPMRSTSTESRARSRAVTPSSVASAGPRPFVTQSPARVVRAAARAGSGHRDLPQFDGRSRLEPPAGYGRADSLPRRQPVPYNRWKAHGERALRSACRETGTRFVILRPGIVHGPRSQWITRFARGLLDGSGYVVAGGRGICNAIYVDNLAHAVDLALEREEAAGETFLVADDGAVSWRMLYEPVCRWLGCSWDSVTDLAPRVPRLMPAERLLGLKDDPTARVVLDRVPRMLRDPVRRLAVRRHGGESPQGTPRQAPLEDSILQTCGYRFPTAKARRLLGFEPPVSFDEASRRNVSASGSPAIRWPLRPRRSRDGIASRLGRDDRARRRAVPRRGARQRSRPDLQQPSSSSSSTTARPTGVSRLRSASCAPRPTACGSSATRTAVPVA